MSQPLPPLPPLDMNIVAAQADAKRILSAIEQGQQPNAQLLENFQADLKRLENDPHVPQNVKHELMRDAKLNPEEFAKLGDEALSKLVGEVNGLKPNIPTPSGPTSVQFDPALVIAQSGAQIFMSSNFSPSQISSFINTLTDLQWDTNIPSGLRGEVQQALAHPNDVNNAQAWNIANQLLNL